MGLRSQLDRDAFFWQVQDGRLPSPRCALTLGIRVVSVDPEAGVVHAEFEGKDDFVNPAGNIQGGFLSAMLDDTMGLALSPTLAAGEFAPTINLNVQFLSVARTGKIEARGRIEKRGREICYMSAELTQHGRVVATATAAAIVRKAG